MEEEIIKLASRLAESILMSRGQDEQISLAVQVAEKTLEYRRNQLNIKDDNVY